MATTDLIAAPERTDRTVDDRSEADRAAFLAASHVRRVVEPTPDLPPLPKDPAARARALKIRGW